jgi:hypothetical protein
MSDLRNPAEQPVLTIVRQLDRIERELRRAVRDHQATLPSILGGVPIGCSSHNSELLRITLELASLTGALSASMRDQPIAMASSVVGDSELERVH